MARMPTGVGKGAKPYRTYRPSGVKWLGEVPEHWGVRRLKDVGVLIAGAAFPEALQGLEGEELPFFKVADLDKSRDGRWLEDPEHTISREAAAEIRARVIPQRSVVYAKIGAALLLNRRRVNSRPACIDNNMSAYVPDRDQITTHWALYTLSLLDFGEHVNPGAVPSLSEGDQAILPLPIPPLDEQRAIADYLDRKTERIDSLAAKMRLFIERLREYRTALITRTVTRGLPPNAARVAGLDPSPRLKPSGVEWLGKVPEHWEVKPLRSWVSFRGGSTPSKSREEFWDGDIPWVSPKDMKRAFVADSEDHVTSAALAESGCTMLPVPSVLVVVRGMILAHSLPAAITTAPVTINQDMKALVTHEPLSHRFLYWFLVGAARALVSLCDESAHGTRKLETATLAGFLTPLPPHGEQAAIATFLDAETTRLDGLVRRAVSAIERLQEYRTALITAAVTGKVDVREPVTADGS